MEIEMDRTHPCMQKKCSAPDFGSSPSMARCLRACFAWLCSISEQLYSKILGEITLFEILNYFS